MKIKLGADGSTQSATNTIKRKPTPEDFSRYGDSERQWIEMEDIHEARREGRKLMELAASLLVPELEKLKDEGRDEFWRLMLEAAKKRWKPRNEPFNPKRPAKSLLPQGYKPPSVETSIGRVTFQNNDPAPQDRKPSLLPPGTVAHRMAEARESVVTAERLIEDICGLAESGDIPDAGWDFAQSVVERSRGIGETVEQRGRATEAQIEALENMLSGLEKWVR